MSKWTEFLTKYYNEKKKSNPDYKLKDAMKDAAKEYKKSSGSSTKKTKKEECVEKCMSKGGSKKKGRKNKTQKKKRGGDGLADVEQVSSTEPSPESVAEESSEDAAVKGGGVDASKPGDAVTSFVSPK